MAKINDLAGDQQVGVELLGEIPELVRREVRASRINTHSPERLFYFIPIMYQQTLVVQKSVQPVIYPFEISQGAPDMPKR